MEPNPRGRRKNRQMGPEAGAFRPALPEDVHAVVRVYAIAARAVCAKPDTLAAVNQLLGALQQRLVPPEAAAAEACHRLWGLFARVAQIPKENLRQEAGRALCRDLDRLAQGLDLPPLDDWQDLPAGIDAPQGAQWASAELRPEPVTLAAVRARAQDVVQAQSGAGQPFPATEAARLLAVLGSEQRRELFEKLVGAGLMGRADVNLLIRFLVKGGDVTPADTTLTEVLQRLGAWLTAPAP